MHAGRKTRGRDRTIVAVVAVAVMSALILGGCGVGGSLDTEGTTAGVTTRFDERDDALVNPLMGYAPLANNSTAAEDASLVFVLLTWRDWEPEKGQFDVAELEEHFNLARWRESGKRVVLRFVCDVPGSASHVDIPDWLLEETGEDGVHYDISYGRGYSPDYDNDYFIERHEKAIEALGRYFEQDSFVAYVEVGSLGHWGEWHVDYSQGLSRIPDEETCRSYVESYLSSFSDAKLLMRRPFSFVTEYGLGIYNDMIGHTAATNEWLGWISSGGEYGEPEEPWALTAAPDSWMKNPLGGEFTSSVPMEDILGSELDTTLELLAESHVTFIGPKIAASGPSAGSADGASLDLISEGSDAVLRSIGYRFVIPTSVVTVHSNGSMSVELEWENRGMAPMYWDWPVYLYLLDERGAVMHRQQIDLALTSLLPGTTLTTETTVGSSRLSQGGGRIAVGIEDPQTSQPAVTLAMSCETVGGLSVIGSY